MIGMAFGLGFILGPVIGSLSYKWLGLSGPGWVAAVICTINFILACFILTESRLPLKEKAPQRARLNQIQRVFALPGVGFLIGIYFLATFAFTSFETTLPLLLGKRLGLGEDRGEYETPCFMPVGTRGAIRHLSAQDYETLGARIVLGNTYHLMLRPGAQVVSDMG